MPNPVVSTPASAADMKYREDVKFLNVFKTEKEPKGDPNTDKYAGGKKFRAGSWRSVGFEPGKAEKKSRPKRGLFRD